MFLVYDETACKLGKGEGLRMMVSGSGICWVVSKKMVSLLESQWINLYPYRRGNREELTSAEKARSRLHLLICGI